MTSNTTDGLPEVADIETFEQAINPDEFAQSEGYVDQDDAPAEKTPLSVEDWKAAHPSAELRFWSPQSDDAWLCSPDGLNEVNNPFMVMIRGYSFDSMDAVNDYYTNTVAPQNGLELAAGTTYFTSSPYGTCAACGVSVEAPAEQSA